MTTKHTPLYLRAIDLEGAGIDLRFICTDDEEINEQAKRNAHLIAAAPDMYDALVALRDAKRNSTQDLRRVADRILDAAIAKAEGR